MTTLYEGAFAKLNLTLDVKGKRDDGFHDIESIMQTVSIRDDVEIDVGTGKPWKLQCSDDTIPADETNLAWKAARLFLDTIHQDPDGLEIRITKRIPAGAGLGGGSADAAAVLRALNKHYGSPLSIGALAELGSEIGSDVPFCTICGTALVTGRGDQIQKLPDVPEFFLVVTKPDFSVSTPDLYQKIDEITIPEHPNTIAMQSAILAGDLHRICDTVLNVFDPIVTQDHLELNYIKSIFNSYGALIGMMTGTGSACYAITDTFETAIIICSMIKEKYPKTYICKPV